MFQINEIRKQFLAYELLHNRTFVVHTLSNVVPQNLKKKNSPRADPGGFHRGEKTYSPILGTRATL